MRTMQKVTTSREALDIGTRKTKNFEECLQSDELISGILAKGQYAART